MGRKYFLFILQGYSSVENRPFLYSSLLQLISFSNSPSCHRLSFPLSDSPDWVRRICSSWLCLCLKHRKWKSPSPSWTRWEETWPPALWPRKCFSTCCSTTLDLWPWTSGRARSQRWTLENSFLCWTGYKWRGSSDLRHSWNSTLEIESSRSHIL